MKFLKISMACIACFCIATSSYALTAVPEGQDQRIEWKLTKSWPTESRTLDMVYSLDGKYVYILNDKQQVQIFNREGQLQGNIPIEQGVSTIDISPQGDSLYLINNVKNTFSSISVSFVVDIGTADSPFEGPADALVTLVVFTDFE
jgi:DNA-binding beta-propeller fold protein YncE